MHVEKLKLQCRCMRTAQRVVWFGVTFQVTSSTYHNIGSKVGKDLVDKHKNIFLNSAEIKTFFGVYDTQTF